MADFALSAFVRIDATNNDLRIIDNGTPRIFSLTTGVYTLGFGSASPNSATDSSTYGFTSFLEQIEMAFTDTTNFSPAPGAGLTWSFALQTLYNGSSGVTAGATGHVWVQPDNATDQIQFDSSLTTMSPEWFGVGTDANGDYNNHSFASTNYEDISDFSSVLAVVGTRTMGAEGLTEDPKDRGFVADDGSTYWEYLSDDLDSLRELIVNGSGLPRDSANSDYHTFRRFMRRLRLNQSGRKFYYFPDLSVLDWGKWDPNSTAVERRWGQQLFSLDPRQPVRFSDPKRFATYNQEWQVRLPVIQQASSVLTYEALIETAGSAGQCVTISTGAIYCWVDAISLWIRKEASDLVDADVAISLRVDGDVVPASETPAWTDQTNLSATITSNGSTVEWNASSGFAKSEATWPGSAVDWLWQGRMNVTTTPTQNAASTRDQRLKNGTRRVDFQPWEFASGFARLTNANTVVGTINTNQSFLNNERFFEIVCDTVGNNVSVFVDNEQNPSLSANYTAFAADGGFTVQLGQNQGDASPNFDWVITGREIKGIRLT